jgi:sec-independent protein translocase protein TatA
MGEFSLSHWLVVLVVGVVLFGPSKLPELGRSLGQSIAAFKKGLKEGIAEE